MDFFRARAIPALIAALSVPAAAGAGPGCAAIDGTYRYEAIAPRHDRVDTLAVFATPEENRKLFAPTAHGTPLKLSGNGVIQRGPKEKALASRVTFAYAPGSTRLSYLDAAGQPLVESRLEESGPWRCEGTRLVLVHERMAGLGDAIRTERDEEVLERDGKGNLVHRETITVVEGAGQSRVEEARYAPIP